MTTPGPPSHFLSRLLGVEPEEAPAVTAGVLMFFLLFAGYFLLRPVRETMGIAGGVKNLQWLFTGTFIATLAAIPLFGWVAARAPRRRILPWTYGFFALNLLGFALEKRRFGCYRPPLASPAWQARLAGWERKAGDWQLSGGGFYLLVARKIVVGLRPVRQERREPMGKLIPLPMAKVNRRRIDP